MSVKSPAERLKKTVEERGLGVNEFGARVGALVGHKTKTTGYGSKLVNGKVAFSEEMTRAICDVLDVNADWLLFGTGEPNRSGPRAPISEAENFEEALAKAQELAGEEISVEVWRKVSTVTFSPPLKIVSSRTLYELARAFSTPGV
jgi:transcriptional regulator with XRE-family HTH domain